MNSSQDKPSVVILGGGTGGVVVANLLGRKAKKLANITLISKRENVFYEPDMIFRVFDNSPKKAMKTLDAQFKPLRKVVNKNVNILHDEVRSVDPKNRVIGLTNGNSLSYDYLVIATGAHYENGRVNGYNGEVHHFYDTDATLKLRDALESFEGGEIIIGVSDLPYKCPIAPIEMTMMLQDYFRRRKMLDKVKIHYISPLGGAFSIEAASQKFEAQFEKKDIEMHEFFNVDAIKTDEKVLESLEGEELNYDLLILVPPHVGATYIDDPKLADESGWLKVDKDTLQNPEYPEVFGVGDTNDLPISKAGSTAHYQAKTVSKNILNLLKGKNHKAKYDGHAQCFVMMSLNSAMLLDFSYTRAPRRIGYIPNKFYYWFKKFFKPIYFRGVLTGRI